MPATKTPVLSARVTPEAILELEEIIELTNMGKGEALVAAIRKLRSDPAIVRVKDALDGLKLNGHQKKK